MATPKLDLIWSDKRLSPQFIAGANILPYFCQSASNNDVPNPFYDSSCNNERLKQQQQPMNHETLVYVYMCMR